MELRHLRYVVAVADELSFRRAALRVRVAQPALGRQIKDVEDELGAPLFTRDRQHVALTDAGRVFVPDARRLLADATALIERTRDASRGVAGILRIGNIGQLTASFLPDTLAAFREAYPRVDVDIQELSTEEQRIALLDGTVQLGFCGTHQVADDAALSHRPFVSCGAWVILPTRHRLAEQKLISVKSLAEDDFLTYIPRHGGGHEQWLQRVCRDYGAFSPQEHRKVVEHFNALFGMVAARAGITILPTLSMRSLRGGKGWVARRIRVPNDIYQFSAIWKAGPPSPLVANYLGFLKPIKLR